MVQTRAITGPGIVMVNFFVWSLLVLKTGVTADEASESRFVEVIIRDLEQSQFLHKIEDKVILFPNQLKAQLKLPVPETEPETKRRIRRSNGKRSWAQIQAKRSNARRLRAQRKAQLQKNLVRQRQLQQLKQQRASTVYDQRDSEHSYVGATAYGTNSLSPAKRFGGWTSWNGWTSCSATCGDGYRSRRRFCANASLGSDSCPGLATEHVPCGSAPCHNYQWTIFQYTECNKSCGGGLTQGTRKCVVQGTSTQVDDRRCKGVAYASYPCNTQQCQIKVEYEWSGYQFTECSRSCSGGDQYGTRSCMVKGSDKQVDDKFCNGNTFYRRECNTQSCEVPVRPKSTGGPKCGSKPKKDGPKGVQLRITGGQIADDGDWPWQVSLQHRTCKKSHRFGSDCTWKHMCGASIVDKKWVVTAAHCIEESGYYTDNNNPGDDWAVVIGMDKLNYNHGEHSNGQDGKRHLLKKIIPHPDYVFTYITHSDVALLQLRDEIEYNDEVQPICLPSGREPAHGQQCHITGWGYTHGKGEVLSHHLRHATIPMVNFGQCRKTGIWYKLLKEDVHMCGGDVNKGGVDSCGGDSGGPLTCQDPETKMYYLAGVTSFGFSDCGKRGHLGIYARMKNFESWIRKTIDADAEPDFDHEPFYGGYQYYSQYKTLGSIKMYG